MERDREREVIPVVVVVFVVVAAASNFPIIVDDLLYSGKAVEKVVLRQSEPLVLMEIGFGGEHLPGLADDGVERKGDGGRVGQQRRRLLVASVRKRRGQSAETVARRNPRTIQLFRPQRPQAEVF